MSLPRVLCIMGSGETAPTMVSIHTDLLARLDPGASAVLLDTPFGFQENADDLVVRAREYFQRNVGHDIEVATFRNAEAATELEREVCAARIAGADYVFAGPGSPTYALAQWRGSAVPDLLRDKLRGGGIVTFASAAAVSLGAVALPVYEIYKVGQPVHWLDGLDLLAEAGLHVALIPHYNNAEGGTHDTRFCYMGERRLRLLEEMMPADLTVLGVDEHTALIIDLDAGTASVRGRGRVVHRHRDDERVYESGAEVSLDELRGAVSLSRRAAQAHPAATPEALPAAPTPFVELVDGERRRFDEGRDRGDVEAMVGAVLAIESALVDWSADTLASDERDNARALMRRLVVQLGDIAREGAADPRERVAPFVEAMLELREQARRERRFADADRLRDALLESGVEVRDGRGGSEWVLVARSAPAG